MINTKYNGISSHGELPPVFRRTDVPKLYARPDFAEMNESDYLVRFYEADSFVLTSLNDFIGTGSDTGNACIVVGAKSFLDKENPVPN